jgi:hypothetical protein
MASRTLRNQIIGLEQADGENMSGGFSADLPCGQGDRVEIEGSAITVENLNVLGGQVRATGKPPTWTRGLGTTRTQRKLRRKPKVNIVQLTLPLSRVIYKTCQHDSVDEGWEAGNAELASSVEQKMKEGNDQMREEIRRDNEKLVEQFRLENLKLGKEFSGKLQNCPIRLGNCRVTRRKN